MKIVIGTVVLVDEGCDMAAFSPVHYAGLCYYIYTRLHLKYSAFFLWRSCRWQLFLVRVH